MYEVDDLIDGVLEDERAERLARVLDDAQPDDDETPLELT
jgi:hypothetical protein